MSIMQSGVVEVKLTKGLVAIIDAEDFELVSQHKWVADTSGVTAYAIRTQRVDGKRRNVKLHRVLLNAPDGVHVDHINGNGLDNRRSNLRLCTATENRRNSRKQKGSVSQFKGVWKRPGKRPKAWIASIKIDGKSHVRLFYTELEAALAYDEMAKEHHGEFAKLNFP